jgi:hypothetical protein
MFWEFVTAMMIALLLTLIFDVGLGGRGWGVSLMISFTILFLATWAGGLWIGPFGPTFWGVAWLSFLLAGLFVILTIGALTPRPRKSPSPPDLRRGKEPGGPTERVDPVSFGAFFWALMVGLTVAIIAAYL